MIELDNIYLGDCLEVMKGIPDASVDFICCDLPYSTTANEWDVLIPFDKLWEQYKRIRKPEAATVLFGSEPFSTFQRMSNIREYRYDWIWEKSQGADFANCHKRPLKNYETISVFSQKQAPYYPQGLRRCHKVKSNANKFGTNFKDSDMPDTYVQEYENYPTAILTFPNPAGREKCHPTQKPVDLLRYLILTYTKENAIVLDNCIGSGTTAIAAIREGRHFIGIEKDEGYYGKAVRRIREERMQLKLF